MTTLDPRALIAARTAFDDGEKLSDQLPSAIAAYLAATQPQAGEPVSWGVFARAICESEGRNWTALDNPREDCERWIKAGQACAALVSPQPANPAQVTEEAVEIGRNAFYDHRGEGSAVEVGIRAALAAIGADGQAVAVKSLKWERQSNGNLRGLGSAFNYRYIVYPRGGSFLLHHANSFTDDQFETEDEAKAAAQSDYERRVLSALSQPHPADERAVEADGVALIAAERRRQIEEEGWTAEHDDAEHKDGELGRAAAAYALSGMKKYRLPTDLACGMKGIIADIWPWGQEWFKPRGEPDAVIRSLVKAGALIAAEIDQQQRRRALSAKEGR